MGKSAAPVSCGAPVLLATRVGGVSGAATFAGATDADAAGAAGVAPRINSGAVGLQRSASPTALHTPEISALPSCETETKMVSVSSVNTLRASLQVDPPSRLRRTAARISTPSSDTHTA